MSPSLLSLGTTLTSSIGLEYSYELGVSIQSGDIVWLNGPFPCGLFADQKIAKEEGLEDSMDPGQRYLCDGVYQYLASSETPNGLNNYDQYMKKVARSPS